MNSTAPSHYNMALLNELSISDATDMTLVLGSKLPKCKGFARRDIIYHFKKWWAYLKKTGNMFINHQNNKEPINVIMRYINFKKTRYIHRYSYVRLHL